MRSRIAVLASGGGSNLDAILEYLDVRGARRGGDVVVVASDRAEAGALGKAARRSIATAHIADPAHVDALDALLREHAIDLVVLAGYLKLVPAPIVQRFHGRMMNVHPALLPAFGGPGMYGIRAHRAVLESGASVSGVSVHFVDAAYDRGPLIAQWPVPVADGDTPETLAARVLAVEHVLYPRCVDAVAAGRIALRNDGRAVGVRASDQCFLLGPPADLVASIDGALGTE